MGHERKGNRSKGRKRDGNIGKEKIVKQKHLHIIKTEIFTYKI